MSMILKGIDLPKMGEGRRIVIYDNGDVVVNEEGWDEDGYNKHYRTIYDVQAIQIPKGHGRLIDKDELLSHLKKDPLFSLVERYGISGVIESRPTILEAEE